MILKHPFFVCANVKVIIQLCEILLLDNI